MDDIDERVAIEVMGWRIDSYRANCFFNAEDAYYSNDPLPSINVWEFKIKKSEWQPSKRIDQAWMVVEQMKVDGWTLLLCQQRGGLWVAGFDNVDNPKVSDDADTAPMAICLASLKIKGD